MRLAHSWALVDTTPVTFKNTENKTLSVSHVILHLEAEYFFLSTNEDPWGAPRNISLLSFSLNPYILNNIYLFNKFLEHLPHAKLVLSTGCTDQGRSLTAQGHLVEGQVRAQIQTTNQSPNCRVTELCLLKRMRFSNFLKSTVWDRNSPAHSSFKPI